MMNRTSIRIIVYSCMIAVLMAGCDSSTSPEYEDNATKDSATNESPAVAVQEVEAGNPFREIFPREEYDKRMEVAAEHIESSIHLATETKHPLLGVKFTRVAEELTAKTGLQKGSILYQRGDRKSWARFLPTTLLQMPGPYTAYLIDPDDNEQEVELEPGLLKVSYIKVYRLDIAYLRNEIGERDSKWDHHLTFAGLAFPTNKKLAETALHHAIEAGYQQDELTDFYQVTFKTLTKEGPEKAMEKFLSNFEGKEIPWIYIPPLHRVLVATGRIDFMQRIADEAGKNCIYDAEEIKKFLKWTEGKTRWPEGSLLERANARRGRSIAKIFKSSQRIQIFESDRRKEDQLIPGPPIKNEFGFNSPPGGYIHFEYTSDDIPQNIHQHLTIKLQASGLDHGWPTRFRIDWVNLYTTKNPAPKNRRFYRLPPRQFLRFSIGTNFLTTILETSGNGLPGLIITRDNLVSVPFIEKPKLPDSLQETFIKRKDELTVEPQTLEIDMIRYRNEIGIFVNGICYLHLPTDPNPKVNIDLNIISLGMKGTIEKQAIWELKD